VQLVPGKPHAHVPFVQVPLQHSLGELQIAPPAWQHLPALH